MALTRACLDPGAIPFAHGQRIGFATRPDLHNTKHRFRQRLRKLLSRRVRNPGQWPRLMRAETAAAYLDEPSVESFLRKVGTRYPRHWTGKGELRKWHIEDLDLATNPRWSGNPAGGAVRSLADDL